MVVWQLWWHCLSPAYLPKHLGERKGPCRELVVWRKDPEDDGDGVRREPRGGGGAHDGVVRTVADEQRQVERGGDEARKDDGVGRNTPWAEAAEEGGEGETAVAG